MKCGPVDESIETTDEHFNDVELLSDVSLITLSFETSELTILIISISLDGSKHINISFPDRGYQLEGVHLFIGGKYYEI